jgi:maleate isomerase
MTNPQDQANPNPAVELDDGPHFRAELGFVLIPNSRLVETEMARLAPKGVGVHFARGRMPRETTVKSLAAMGESLGDAAASLLPGEELDVISYACTSGSLILGEEKVQAELKKGRMKCQATSTIGASIAALHSLGARRLAIGTAYIDEVNEVEAKYLTERGFDVLAIHGLNLLHDSEIIRVSPNFIRDFACSIDRPDADAIFLSCGALRAVEVIDEIEQIVGKPVVTSNQALLWHCLKLAGVDERPRKCGRLMQNY